MNVARMRKINPVLLKYEMPSSYIYSDTLDGVTRFLIENCDWNDQKKENFKKDIKKLIKGRCEVYI